MGTLKPKEFMELYPIPKEYDGHKYEIKDYFYTRDYIKGLEQENPIGTEVFNLLWEYQNRDLIHFNVNFMEYMKAETVRWTSFTSRRVCRHNGIKNL